jgi:hypothetical protein
MRPMPLHGVRRLPVFDRKQCALTVILVALALGASARGEGVTGTLQEVTDSWFLQDIGHPSFNIFDFQVFPIDWRTEWTAPGLAPLSIEISDITLAMLPPGDANALVLRITPATAPQYGLDWTLLDAYLDQARPRLEFDTQTTISSSCSLCQSEMGGGSTLRGMNNPYRVVTASEVEVFLRQDPANFQLPGQTISTRGVRFFATVAVRGIATVPEPGSLRMVLVFGVIATGVRMRR